MPFKFEKQTTLFKHSQLFNSYFVNMHDIAKNMVASKYLKTNASVTEVDELIHHCYHGYKF